MIRKTLKNTRAAVFALDLPNKYMDGMPVPTGTGFFVSPDGYFVTAAHVVMEENKVRQDIGKGWAGKELEDVIPAPQVRDLKIVEVLPEFDFALLKADFSKHSNSNWLKGRNGFPFLSVSKRDLEVGESVYAYGYPLSDLSFNKRDNISEGVVHYSPRLTSAIVSSNIEITGFMTSIDNPRNYVLDKALNYGNSGGPIISVDTGNAYALCSRFQPVCISQPHITSDNDEPLSIYIPSLYGIVASLNNTKVLSLLESLGVPLASD